jgi:hypothetical protein
VSRIEPGSKVSVAGLKPYEIITHVNDEPVADVGAFKKLITGQQELRLSVKRMTRSRIVKLRLDKPIAAEAAGEGDTGEAGKDEATGESGEDSPGANDEANEEAAPAPQE